LIPQTLNGIFMNEWVIIISALFVINIFLTILDLYPLIRSFWFFATPSYYILMLTLFVLYLLAAYILKSQILKNGDLIAILVISSLGTFAVIQSFTLQFGNYKLINLTEMINEFKVTVRYDADKIRAKSYVLKTQIIAKKLSEKNIGTKELEMELESLLSQKHPRNQRRQIIEEIENYSKKKGLDLKRLLANRIAQVDLERANQLAKDC